MDLDGTIANSKASHYGDCAPNTSVIKKMQYYREAGFNIVIFTARNMFTYKGDIDKINIYTLPVILDWLARHKVPYDEVILGKPWCGNDGFYVDDRAIRPEEFATLSREEINTLLGSGESHA